MNRKRQPATRSASPWSKPPAAGVANGFNHARRAVDAQSPTRQSASSASGSSADSRAQSPSSQDAAALEQVGDVCATEKPPKFWSDDLPDSPILPDEPLPSDTPDDAAAQADAPPGLYKPPRREADSSPSPQRPARKKYPSRPCLVVKLTDLPRYATKEQVKTAVAKELHSDRFDTDDQSARRSKMTTGFVNFEVLMEYRYSSAQNVGYAFVLLPYGYHGWRLQERGVKMLDPLSKQVHVLQVIPVTHFEPTPSKKLLLQKTPYQDPSALLSLNEKKAALSGDIRIRTVELGSLQKDPRRAFSAEWSQEFTQRPCLLSFDDNLSSFRISYGGHADTEARSIVVRIATVQTLLYGYDFGRQYIVFHLLTSPAFESGLNVNRATDAQKKDLENIRQRLSFLDDAHRPSAPYAFQLLIEPLDDLGFQEFLRKGVVACLPRGIDLRAAPRDRQIQFERRNLYGIKYMDKLMRWLKSLDFVIAFQIEALVRNVLLAPEILLAIQPELQKILRSAYSLGVKSDIIRQFAHLIRKSTKTQGVLHSDLAGLRSLLAQAEADNLRLMESSAAKQAKALAKQAKAALEDGGPDEGLLPQVVDSSAFLCYHVTVTPTAIHLEGPFPVLSNRVLRKYSQHQHCFCRVHFTNEEHNQFRWEREVDGHEFVRSHVGGILKHGVELAGRHFDFLAYSFGALKEHTVWFVTPFNWHVTEHGRKLYDGKGRPVMQYVDADYIRSSLGDFSKVIHCPSQYGARLSQAFSATYPSVRVAKDEVVHIDDIFGRDRTNGLDTGRLMSDGCAPCSPQLAADIDRVLMEGKTRGDDNPAPKAYQMRIGGSKGMIYVDPRLEGRVLCLRPSMNKFDAPDSLDIEISNVPRASAMYLNRPLIMVLEDLGVRLSTFMRLQQDTMDSTLEAAKSIQRFRVMLSQLKLGSRFNVHYILGTLADWGFGFQDDCSPDGSDDMGILLSDYFFHDLVRATVWDVFRQIKYRARIRVPDSWTLVGVLDEHEILQPGEVMAYIKDSENPNGHFLRGQILICRSPVVHPGDVQMVTAVDPPDGSPLKREPLANCVVFSALGARSVPSALGGGDLDGDLFHVSEYQDIHVSNPFRPAEYAAGDRRTLDRPSTIEDVADFVVEYINSDVLGLVSTTHLIIADQHPDGVRATKCMRLAELHSNAVDYAKTGIPVPQLRIPHFEFPAKPDWKADEMGDPESAEFYQSQRALGHLYRRVKLAAADPETRAVQEKKDVPADDIDKIPEPTKNTQDVEGSVTAAVWDKIEPYIEDLDALPDLHERLDKIFKQYVYELRRICTLHALHINSPLSEMEVMLGTILRKSAQPKRRKELAARMHVHTSQLVGAVTSQLMPTGGDDTMAMYKAWQAWLYVSGLPLEQSKRGLMEKPFGAKSFGMIALGAIFKLLERLEQRSPALDEGPLDTMDDFDMD